MTILGVVDLVGDLSDFYHKLKGSEWDPWEMFFMTSPRCKNLIMRDKITANNLNKKKINAKYLGNPMMDFVYAKNQKISNIISFKRIILLIGSRYPEASGYLLPVSYTHLRAHET